MFSFRLLWTDLVRASDADTKADMVEAARVQIARMPFLAGVHALAWAVAVWSGIDGHDDWHAAALTGGATIIDMGIWALTGKLRAERLKPHRLILAMTLFGLIGAGLLGGGAALSHDPVVAAAAYAAILVSALAFLSMPVAVLAVGLVATGAVAASGLSPAFAVLAGGFTLLMTGFALHQRGWQRALAETRALPPVVAGFAQPAVTSAVVSTNRFVDEFEQSGRGWFWETDANGRLSYISEPLARQIGSEPGMLIGHPFGEIISDEDEGEDNLRSERTTSFYISMRMAFTDVTVKANATGDIWWSVSGRPVFDESGVYLGFRGVGSDLSEKKRAEAEVRRLARYDSLTGLPNRNSMMRTLEEALRVATPGRSGSALMLLDLDRFKAVNDSQGHMTGDELLKLVARRLTEVLGKTGQVGRLGGDEFKIVLPRLDDPEELARIANKAIAYVSIPYRINGRTFSIGASVGIAIAEAGEQDADALIGQADLALYAAKATGRGNARFFEPEMQSAAQDRQEMEQELREAMADGSLELYYQPVVHSATETLAGFEALLRWNHPTQGYIPPSIFIPVAEESGLIVALGEWVIRTACTDAATMPQDLRIAVNLSPIQFASPNLPAVIISALAASQLPASRLELEITEGVFLSQDPKTDEIFAKLKSIGVRLALDDFGTGYSSLGYLRTAPFDKIKIDQSFVRGATVEGSRNVSILRAIVDLAEGLGMDTTAEGAETYDELELIRELGCSHVQGLIFGRAVPAAEALKLAQKGDTVDRIGFVTARSARQRLIRKGVLHHNVGATPTIIRNISEGGALIECKRGFPPGSRVTLEVIGCGLLEAEIRWWQGDRLGLMFTAEFDMGRLTKVSPTNTPNAKMMTPDYLKQLFDEEGGQAAAG